MIYKMFNFRNVDVSLDRLIFIIWDFEKVMILGKVKNLWELGELYLIGNVGFESFCSI